MLTNFSHDELILHKATVLGVAEGVSETLVDTITEEETLNTESCTRLRVKSKIEALYKKLLAGNLDHLFHGERQLIEPALQKYAHLFHDEDTNDFKSTDVIEHKIIEIRHQ